MRASDETPVEFLMHDESEAKKYVSTLVKVLKTTTADARAQHFAVSRCGGGGGGGRVAALALVRYFFVQYPGGLGKNTVKLMKRSQPCGGGGDSEGGSGGNCGGGTLALGLRSPGMVVVVVGGVGFGTPPPPSSTRLSRPVLPIPCCGTWVRTHEGAMADGGEGSTLRQSPTPPTQLDYRRNSPHLPTTTAVIPPPGVMI